MQKIILTVILAIFSLMLLGAKTKPGYPACVDLNIYNNFLKSIILKDFFATEYYMEESLCGLTKPEIKATIVKEGSYWIRVLVEPEGTRPFLLYMDKGALEEENENENDSKE